MSTSNPRIQKKIGRKVANFVPEKWAEMRTWGEGEERPYCWQIVWKANYAKFTQNKGLKKELLDTEGRLLVEASPYDVIWGIGLGEDDPMVDDPANWQGTNWLGEVITDVRKAIKEGTEYPGSV